MVNDKTKSIIGIIFIIALFITVSYIVQNNTEALKNYIKDDFFSMIIYVLILIVSIL